MSAPIGRIGRRIRLDGEILPVGDLVPAQAVRRDYPKVALPLALGSSLIAESIPSRAFPSSERPDTRAMMPPQMIPSAKTAAVAGTSRAFMASWLVIVIAVLTLLAVSATPGTAISPLNAGNCSAMTGTGWGYLFDFPDRTARDQFEFGQCVSGAELTDLAVTLTISSGRLEVISNDPGTTVEINGGQAIMRKASLVDPAGGGGTAAVARVRVLGANGGKITATFRSTGVGPGIALPRETFDSGVGTSGPWDIGPLPGAPPVTPDPGAACDPAAQAVAFSPARTAISRKALFKNGISVTVGACPSAKIVARLFVGNTVAGRAGAETSAGGDVSLRVVPSENGRKTLAKVKRMTVRVVSKTPAGVTRRNLPVAITGSAILPKRTPRGRDDDDEEPVFKRFRGFSQTAIKCPFNCGSLTAVHGTVAVKDDASKDWDDQVKVDFSPFKVSGRFSLASNAVDSNKRPITVRDMCIEASLSATFSSRFGLSTAPLGSINLVVSNPNQPNPIINGKVASFAGYSCTGRSGRSAAASLIATGISQSPDVHVDGLQAYVDKATIGVRATVYLSNGRSTSTPWSRKTLTFDD